MTNRNFHIFKLGDEYFIADNTPGDNAYLLKDGTVADKIPSMLGLGYWETYELAHSFLEKWNAVNE